MGAELIRWLDRLAAVYTEARVRTSALAAVVGGTNETNNYHGEMLRRNQEEAADQKVMIKGKCFFHAMPTHDNETNGINIAKILICILA